jgi:hypothetical protein
MTDVPRARLIEDTSSKLKKTTKDLFKALR